MPPQIVYALEPLPGVFPAAVYLGGASGTDETGAEWRQQLVMLLIDAGFDGVIYWPESRDGGQVDPARLHVWQHEALRHADAILLWFPCEPDGETLELWGAWRRSGKVVFGAPKNVALHARRSATQFRVPSATSLTEAVEHLMPLLRPGVSRAGGERAVPLLLWRSPAFARWYSALRAAGNELDDVEVEWIYRLRAGTGRPPLIWALRPRIWVRRERRHKGGEVVVGRAEVSATVLYSPSAHSPSVYDTEVVLVREFRSAGTGPLGLVWELPGGSAECAADRDQDPRLTAVREVEQETGLRLRRGQLQTVPLGARQIAATILSHRAHLFRARLSEDQLAILKEVERTGAPHGANPGERCYVAVRTVGSLVRGGELDWSQLGMILYALRPELKERDPTLSSPDED